MKVLDEGNDPYRQLVKKMLLEILYVKNAVEESFATANNLEADALIEDDIRNKLIPNLQVADKLLESTYNVGLVALTESAEVALNPLIEANALIGDCYQVRQIISVSCPELRIREMFFRIPIRPKIFFTDPDPG